MTDRHYWYIVISLPNDIDESDQREFVNDWIKSNNLDTYLLVEEDGKEETHLHFNIVMRGKKPRLEKKLLKRFSSHPKYEKIKTKGVFLEQGYDLRTLLKKYLAKEPGHRIIYNNLPPSAYAMKKKDLESVINEEFCGWYDIGRQNEYMQKPHKLIRDFLYDNDYRHLLWGYLRSSDSIKNGTTVYARMISKDPYFDE